jgi:hypothetical protein
MMAATVPTDSLQALSGIRIALGMAIPAVPFTGKVSTMEGFKRTHCHRGHLLSDANTKIERKGNKERRWCRICKGISERRNNRSGKLGAGVIRRVFEAAHEGKTRQQIDGFSGGKYVGGRITKHQKLKLWIEENPVLGRRLKRLLDANAKRIKCAPRRLIAAPAIMKNNGMDAYGAVQAACRHVWEDIRTDISADMLLAIAEGRLNPRDAALRVCECVTAHNRQFSRFVPGDGIMQSLDQQVYDDGPTRLVDTVTHGLWD